MPGTGNLKEPLPLLHLFLTVMPEEIKQQQVGNFSQVAANFEFGTWVHPYLYAIVVREATKQGFITWQNIDKKSAFIYGAGTIPLPSIKGTLEWLRQITFPGQKGQALIGKGSLFIYVTLDSEEKKIKK